MKKCLIGIALISISIIIVWFIFGTITANRNKELAEFGLNEFKNKDQQEFDSILAEASGLEDLATESRIAAFSKDNYDKSTKTLKICVDLRFYSKDINKYYTEEQNENGEKIASILYSIQDILPQLRYSYSLEGTGNVELYFDQSQYLKIDSVSNNEYIVMDGLHGKIYISNDENDIFNLVYDKNSNTITSSTPFTNSYGTPTTKCVHSGCNRFIASSGDTNCCEIHSNKCLECGKYIDEDAMYCMDCLEKAAGH